LSLLWGQGPFCWGLGKLWFQGVEGEFRGEGAEGVFVGLCHCLVGGCVGEVFLIQHCYYPFPIYFI
jgi:hypothetical protein